MEKALAYFTPPSVTEKKFYHIDPRTKFNVEKKKKMS